MLQNNSSPFGTLFTLLQQRIKTQVPEIRYIEQDLGQLETEHPPVTYPAILIDFNDWTFEDAAEGLQLATGTVSLRLAFEAFSLTSNMSPESFRNKALHFYDLEWQLYKALHGYKAEQYGHLMRTTVATETREDNLRVRLINFSCHFEDFMAQATYSLTDLPPLEILPANTPLPAPNLVSPFKVRILKP